MQRKKNTRVYLHEMSACCSAGISKEEIMHAVYHGITGIGEHQGFLVDGQKSAIGKMPFCETFESLLISKVAEVLSASKLDSFEQTLLLVGTSVGGMTWAEKQFMKDNGSYRNIILEKQTMHSIAYLLKKEYAFKDAITFSTACTSSSNAIVFAKEILQNGAYENVLVVGADSISYTTVNGFHALGVLSTGCAVPFDISRSGMNVAEGIGVLLFSTRKSNMELAGTGCSSDAYNITHPHPEGDGAKLAMKRALEDAMLDYREVDYINAHGTATVANDAAEAQAISSLFAHSPYVSSTKSVTGHTLGACGAIELIIAAEVLQKQKIPLNFNLKNICLDRLNATKQNIETKVDIVLSNAFAFGGNNVSLILKRVGYES